MTTLLIDADIVAFKWSAATERVYYWDGRDQPPSVIDDREAAIEGAKAYIEELRVSLGATLVVVCLTDTVNFRKEVDATYKANRQGLRKPVHLSTLKDFFKDEYKTYQRPGLEADDCMGILSTHPTLIKGPKVIVSEDKDMQQIPGLLFNPAKDKEPRKITKLQGDRYHLLQTIIGDSTDGYPGAPGVGPKSPEAQAVMLCKTIAEGWRHVMAAFYRTKAYAGSPQAAHEAAVRQARLARILRASDWNFRQSKPVLWVPPKVG